jgi:glucose/arabinose dehydrogenase
MNQTLQPEPVYRFDPILEKLNQPVGFAHLDDERMFVLERNGIIHILEKGRLLDQPFLDISDRVNIEGNIEQGILGIAFHPNIAENRYFYVTYTDADYTVHLSRFLLTDDPNIADSSTEEIMLSAEQTTAAHNGGHIEFGPDGYMYVSIGDGGESIDPRSTGQRTNDLLGKMLRLDVSDESQLYTIPEDNPFVDNPDYRPEIWARGLRNPWIFSFVPDSDAMFIGDVGWSTYEEINYQPAGSTGGENYGWKLYEAEAKIEQTEGTVYEDIPAEDLVFPIYYYPHATPEDYDESFPVGCAIIGGFVYRGEELPELKGKYLYSDFCHGDLWTLHQVGNQWVTERILETDLMVTALGENINGEVYVATFLGEVRRLILDSNDNAQPEGDLDYDLVANQDDNCPEVGNPDQQDNWGDLGVGDACDTNVYITNANDYEVYVYQQHYGAYHIYGCEGLGCGFVASIEIPDLSPDAKLIIESETFTGWMVEAEYSGDFDGSAVYDVVVYDADGNVYIDNLQILINGDIFSWRTIS